MVKLSTKSTIRPTSKLNKKERREAILQGAAKAFVKKGYDACSLDDVADAAGISRALLYRHFDSKRSIYEAILTNTLSHLRGNQDLTAVTGFENRLQPLIETATAMPDGFVLVFRHAAREPEFQAQAATNNVLRQKFIESNLADVISDNTRRQFGAALMRDIIIGTLLTWIDNGQPEPEYLENLLTNMTQVVIESMASNNSQSK
jgi:AcrR family transcriptional regulator